jgi:hypothetical protein
MSLKLTKNPYLATGERPVLLSGDGCSGPYDLASTPPGSKNSTAREIVIRSLANSPFPDDPRIDVETGSDRVGLMSEYLGITDEDFERAEWLVKIARIKKGGNPKSQNSLGTL